MGKNIAQMLQFTTAGKEVIDSLDAFRRHKSVQVATFLSTAMKLLTKTWDELKKLVDECAEIIEQMRTLKSLSSDLHMAAQRYVKSPDNAGFDLLAGSFSDAEPALILAQSKLLKLEKFLVSARAMVGRIEKQLKNIAKGPKSSGWVDRLKNLPREFVDVVLGSKIAEIIDDMGIYGAQMEAAAHLLRLTRKAVDRDLNHLKKLKTRLAEAQAHDLYDRGNAFISSSKHGSALSAFRKVRDTWPDTEWAHRSDRRIVEIEVIIDTFQDQLDKKQAELLAARELSRKNASATAGQSNAPTIAWTLVGLLLATSGWAWFIIWRRRTQA
jgi:hypothetical protein